MSDPPARPRPLLRPDPLVTPPGSPHATPTLARGGRGGVEQGTIVTVDARRAVYRVALASGRTVTAARILASPSDATLLPERTEVVVTFDLGPPYILGVLPGGTAHTDEGPTLSGVDGHGGQDPAFDRGLASNARDPSHPTDRLPGDTVQVAPGGAAVGALRGGVATLSGGPLARVDAFGSEDRVRILSGDLRIETWMGVSETTNEDGHTSLRWRGGTDQVTQTGGGEERYTLHLDVGHVGDVLRFRVTNRETQDLFRVHISSEGRVEVLAAGGVALHGGDRDSARHEATHHGSHASHVTGSETREVDGARTTRIGDGDRLEVEGSCETIATGAVNIVAAERLALQAGSDVIVNAAGRARVSGAGVTLTPGLFEDILVDAVGADRMRIGRGATSHAIKYEELAPLLEAILRALNELRAAFATHTHPGGAPNPAYGQYAVPLTLDFSPSRSLILRLL